MKKNLQQGQALMVATVFFLAISLTVIFGLVGPITRGQKIAAQSILSKQSYFLSEAGMEDVVYRLMRGISVGASENLTLNGSTATTLVTDAVGGKNAVATGDVNDLYRKVKVTLSSGAGAVFKYGTQAGQGGFIFHNNAHVNGSIYANGNVVGSNGAYSTGDIFVAGASGSISNMNIGQGGTGVGYAHTITGSSATGALYCQSGSSNNKSCDTSRPDLPSENLPITDQMISDWKDDAILGGTTNGNVTISTPTTMGPKRINGNLTVNSTLTIADTIYVNGNITINGTVKLSSSYGASSGIIMSDGYIIISNGVIFQDSGTAGSYILILSTSNCDTSVAAAPCYSHNAIDVSNNSAVSIVNAENGTIYFSNNAGVKEAVANKIELKNNVGIDYGSGIINPGFRSGPGGSYTITSWKEIQ